MLIKDKALNIFSIVVGILVVILSLVNIFKFFDIQAFAYFLAAILGVVFVFNELWALPIITEELGLLRHWVGRGFYIFLLAFLLLRSETVSIVFSVVLMVSAALMIFFRVLQIPIPPPNGTPPNWISSVTGSTTGSSGIGTGTGTGTGIGVETGHGTGVFGDGMGVYQTAGIHQDQGYYYGGVQPQQPLIPPLHQQQQPQQSSLNPPQYLSPVGQNYNL